MFEHTRDKESIKKAIRALLKACKDCPEDENSSVAGAIKEESSNIDSEYYEDIFKDIEIKITENSQQALKLSFKIAVDIEDNDLAYSIFDKIKENKLESAILSFIRDKKTEELEDFCENIWACELLSQSKYDQGDKSMSVTLSKQAIRLNQNSKKSWSLLGKIYKEQDMLEEAMEAYLSALRSVDINFSLIPVYLEDI
jgi:tetratricopeptide (TPR) repeat protein